VTKVLEAARAFAEGQQTGDKGRQKTGLSPSEFAKSAGVAQGTMPNWKQGRRQPFRPAQVLLALIAKQPSVVQDPLRGRCAAKRRTRRSLAANLRHAGSAACRYV